MKNTSLILNIVLFIGLGILYALHFTSATDNSNKGIASDDSVATSGNAVIAYVNVDSIMINYDLAQELNDALTSKQANMKSNLEKEMADFEKEAQIFQDKVQKGIYLTQQRAEEAQQKLVMRQQELQNLEMEYSQILAYEQQVMNSRLFDSISNTIKAINSPEKYQVIFAHSVASNILYGADQLDITNIVLDELNERYENNKE